jgi:hypothetical protein
MIKAELTKHGQIRYIVYDTNKRIIIVTSDRKLAYNISEEARYA